MGSVAYTFTDREIQSTACASTRVVAHQLPLISRRHIHALGLCSVLQHGPCFSQLVSISTNWPRSFGRSGPEPPSLHEFHPSCTCDENLKHRFTSYNSVGPFIRVWRTSLTGGPAITYQVSASETVACNAGGHPC